MYLFIQLLLDFSGSYNSWSNTYIVTRKTLTNLLTILFAVKLQISFGIAYICNMIEQYKLSREKFLNELKELFQNSYDLQIDVTVDNISLIDFGSIPLPHKQEKLFCGDYLTASPISEDETKIDTFKSELY